MDVNIRHTGDTPLERDKSYPLVYIGHSRKEVGVMAEILATLAVAGLIVAVAIGMAYLVIYLFGNNGTR